MNPEIVIPMVVAIAVGFLLIPSIIIAATGTRRSATCPDNGDVVQLRLGRGAEVKRLFNDGQRSICDCSRWPENVGCDKDCIGSIT